MPKLNITFKNDDTTERFPIYCKYGGQFQPQPAYIYLDLRDGTCGADYNSEMGSTPIVQWHNNVLTFPISAETRADDIESLINEHAADFQAILDDASIEWDGNNNVGVFGDKATDLLNKLGFYHESNPDGIQDPSCEPSTMIDGNFFPEWVQDNTYPSANQTPEEFAEELHQCDGDNNAYFSDSMNSADAILSALRDIWAEELYSGNDLPKVIAQHLIEHGTCDDSQWMDELKEFANLTSPPAKARGF